MATIQERKNNKGDVTYRVMVRVKGHPTATATFKRKTDARVWAQQTEAAIRDRRYFRTAEAERHTLGELIDRYKRDVLPGKRSRRSQGQQLDWWRERLGVYRLADVTAALVVQCRDELARTPIKTRRSQAPTAAARQAAHAAGRPEPDRKRSPATVARYLAALSHVFSIGVRDYGWLEDSPMRRVTKPREPRGRVRFLTDDERARLLDACKAPSTPFLYPVVVMALSTGMRRGEILGLRWDDVDLVQGRLTLHTTKNGERRVAPLVGHALAVMKDHAKVRRLDNSLVFPGSTGKPFEIGPAWKAAVKRAGLADFRFHDLRHTAASYLAMNGATLAEIAEVLGHRTLAMVKRYSHLSEAHTAGVVAKMNARIFDNKQSQQNGAA